MIEALFIKDDQGVLWILLASLKIAFQVNVAEKGLTF